MEPGRSSALTRRDGPASSASPSVHEEAAACKRKPGSRLLRRLSWYRLSSRSHRYEGTCGDHRTVAFLQLAGCHRIGKITIVCNQEVDAAVDGRLNELGVLRIAARVEQAGSRNLSPSSYSVASLTTFSVPRPRNTISNNLYDGESTRPYSIASATRTKTFVSTTTRTCDGWLSKPT
jgi:hypothetical protein